jgi:hypothetical protein
MKDTCDEYLRIGRETLDQIGYLTPADRERIERGIWHMTCGKALLSSDVSEELREAANRLMTGAAYIMSMTGVSDSEAEYWRRKSCSRGGSRTRPETEEWHRWVLEKITRSPNTRATALTDMLVKEKARPSNLPGRDTLIRFIRAERRKVKAAADTPLRLVHSA